MMFMVVNYSMVVSMFPRGPSSFLTRFRDQLARGGEEKEVAAKGLRCVLKLAYKRTLRNSATQSKSTSSLSSHRRLRQAVPQGGPRKGVGTSREEVSKELANSGGLYEPERSGNILPCPPLGSRFPDFKVQLFWVDGWACSWALAPSSSKAP